MSRRALHPKDDDKDIPTGSPKASPGRPRRNKQQKSTPTSRRRSPKSPHNESEEFESDVDQDTDLESESEDDLDELKSTPTLKNKGLYPDLSRETRQRKKDDASKRGRKGNEKTRESFQTSFEYDNDKANKKDKETSTNIPLISVVVVVVLLIVGFAYTVLSQDEMKVNIKKEHSHEFTKFKEDLTKLKSEFPGQSQRFWKVIGSQVRRILTEESPNYPAILLLSVPNKQEAIGACFTKKIVRLINKAMNVSGDFYINVGNLDSSSPDKTKLDLDQRMLAALDSSKSVILDHIETLPGEAALLLHAYCDGDNAPYKDAVIFLVLHPSKTFPDVESKQDSFVEDILVDLWQDDLGKDEMPALQSRIANNIAVMRTEKDDVCM